MNKKAIVLITVAVVVIALVATGLVIIIGHQAGTPLPQLEQQVQG